MSEDLFYCNYEPSLVKVTVDDNGNIDFDDADISKNGWVELYFNNKPIMKTYSPYNQIRNEFDFNTEYAVAENGNKAYYHTINERYFATNLLRTIKPLNDIIERVENSYYFDLIDFKDDLIENDFSFIYEVGEWESFLKSLFLEVFPERDGWFCEIDINPMPKFDKFLTATPSL